MSAPNPARSGYWLLAGLTLLNVLNFADRFLLVSFANSIITDLALSKFQFTLLTGLIFSVFYVLFGLLAGSLADRFNRPRLIAAGLAVWSALTAATGLAQTFVHAALARVFIGVGEAVLTPSALSMLADRLPPHRHSMAAGVYFLGLPIGTGASFIFAGFLGPVVGWRGTFILLGLIGILTAALVMLLRDPPRGGHAAIAPEAQRIGSFRDSALGMAHALRTTPALVLTLFGAGAAIFASGATVLDIVWWVQERGYTEVRAQQISGTIFLTGGIAGTLIGGVGADAVARRRKGGRLMFLSVAYLVIAPLGLAYRFVPPDTALFYTLAFIGSVGILIPFGAIFATAQELVPVNLRGASVALLILFNTLVGQAGGSALAGYLADRFAAGGMTEPVTWALIAAQLIGLLAIPLFWWAGRLRARAPG